MSVLLVNLKKRCLRFVGVLVSIALVFAMFAPTVAIADVVAGTTPDVPAEESEASGALVEDEAVASLPTDTQEGDSPDAPEPTSPSPELGESEASASSDDAGDSGGIPNLGVNATAHVQTYGWLNAESGLLGEVMSLGTTGESKRVEAFKLDVCTNEGGCEGGIRYRAHVQKYGWQQWSYDGEMAGTTGESKRVEAVQIELTGELANQYDLYYRVHAQSYGWLDWAKNGSLAGTSGYSKRLEAIQIVVLPKGGEAPGSTAMPYVDDSVLKAQKLANSRVSYRTHVQKYGWQEPVYDGDTSGTSGESKRLEAIEVSLAGLIDLEGQVIYRTHVQKYGWQDWVSDGALAGTSGESKRLEAIEIKLTGTVAEAYDIYYRVHAQRFGWMGWAKNGESAGTAGYSYRLEAIQIVLVEKGGQAPGPISGAFAQREVPKGTAQDFVAIALAEPDGRPAGGDSNKYTGYHYDPWCAYFISWCARQANVPKAAIPELYYCPYLKSYYQTKKQWHGCGYTPKAGDLIFYSTRSGGSPTHVGIVTACKNGKVYTKEGNVGSGVVGTRVRIVGSSYVSSGWYVVGYASPTFN